MLDNIVLIGFMGCGKSSVGRWMADNLGMMLIDTDEYIEKENKRTINDIFAKEGEQFFRDLETDLLKRMIDQKCNCVISCGGGMAVREENREYMKKIGPVVYLRTSKETLLKRLKGDDKRPLLKGGDMSAKIDELMSKRGQIYLDAADVIVDTDDKKLEQIYNEIENKILEWRALK